MSGVTNADADAVNEVVRERLVQAGLVDDTVIARGSDGLRIGAGDRVMTRRNDPDLRVANRQTWTVQRVTDSGELTVRGDKPDHLPRVAQLPGGYVRDHVHLAYASTVHAVQGGSWTHSGTSLTEDSDAAGLYVGMSRGTRSNTLFVTAGSLPEAREQFIAASDRNRADLGLLQAVDAARVEMANYGPVRPLTATEQLQQLRDRAAALRAAQAQRRADQPAQRPRPGYGAGYGDGAHQAPRHHGPHL
jgi:ATP-dependent exoDNAse (exonuclease V) alpha subunit